MLGTLILAAGLTGQLQIPYGAPVPPMYSYPWMSYYPPGTYYFPAYPYGVPFGYSRWAVQRPKVIVAPKGLMDYPGVTGRVVDFDEGSRTITLRLPAETVRVRYGPGTKWRSVWLNGFPELRPGVLINIDRDVITVLQ
jgi:hypothetical protein